MELIVMLKPTAIIRFGIPEVSHSWTSLMEFSGSKPVLQQVRGLPTSPSVTLKRQVILKTRKGGVFNTATVGKRSSCPQCALRWV